MFIAPVSIGNFSVRNNSVQNQFLNAGKYPYSTFEYPSDAVSFSGKFVQNSVKKVFDKYKVKEFCGFNVHNPKIFARMKQSYSSEQFKKLFDFANKKGVFDLDINEKTHYITTSLIDPKENPLMGKLVWVTDSARYMPILKDKYPEAAVPLLENMSKFYAKQERNFNKIINDPLQYELNHDWPNTAKNGIGHVFNPKSMNTHKWFAHTRLDSPGLYLQTVSDLITEGFKGAKHGYKNSDSVSDKTVNAISNVTSYLKAIVYPYAKDTGAWEEKTFEITPSSDVAIINEGFRKVLDLMYSKTTNPELLKLRGRIMNSKYGKVFEDENSLRELLKVGEYRIKTNSLEEVPAERDFDGALSFVPHTEKFSDNVLDDAKTIIERMQLLEPKLVNGKLESGLVRDNGTLRYIGDRYLNMTSGHKVNYNKLNKDTEAQWFMTSDISKSYGVAAKKILDAIENKTIKPNAEVKAVLNTAIDKQTEYINRAYGRITGENSFKANNKPCPPYQVPEAYQAVEKSNGEIVFVPGSHTPLGWAQSSLYEASKLMLENLQRIEKCL